MNPKKLGLAAVSVLAAGAIIGGTAAMATAETTPSPSSSSANSGAADSTTRQAPTHTAASADETDKVKAAVAAKDSTVTITTVQKDEDGSFDAAGTKADGTKVKYDVSADYATVSEGKGGRGGHGGGGGGSQDTPVTGDEATKVIDAVKAKDSTVTIDTVRKDPDGSYDAIGTKADGSTVMYDVSSDLATITEGQGGGRGGKGGPAGSSSPSSSSADSSAANGTTTTN